MFGGNDTVCFALRTGDEGKGVYGVFDLKANRTIRLRETDAPVTTITCDPAGRSMVRTAAVGAGDGGTEIWGSGRR